MSSSLHVNPNLSSSPVSTVPFSQYDNQFSCLLRETQDPYEEEHEDLASHATDATMDDLFDALIEI